MPEAGRRRSARVMLTIPLEVEGTDSDGTAFVCEGRTISVNRHGARLWVARPLSCGQQLRLTNLINHTPGEFRVVGSLGSSPDESNQWGVESIDGKEDFWGIHFPLPHQELPESRALLECRQCHTVGVLHVSLLEFEVLDAGEAVLKHCAACSAETLWGNAEKQVSMPHAPQGNTARGAVAKPVRDPAAKKKGRAAHRYLFQRPVQIRDAAGNVEATHTENMSKSGICFTSGKDYHLQQEITLIWPNPASGPRVEVKGRIVRRNDVGGGARRVYGVQYESSAAAHAGSKAGHASWLYFEFAVLVLAAAWIIASSASALATVLILPLESRNRVPDLVALLVLSFFVFLIWKAILGREPEKQQHFRKKHRSVSRLAGGVLAGAIVVGVVLGGHRGYAGARARTLLIDIAIAELLEKNIDSVVARAPATMKDYREFSIALEPLVAQWQRQLEKTSADISQLNGYPLIDSRLERQLGQIGNILSIDEKKATLLREQIDLAYEMGKNPADELSAWQSALHSLRDRTLALNSKRQELIQLLAAGK